jgi:hypothetical protein
MEFKGILENGSGGTCRDFSMPLFASRLVLADVAATWTDI